MVVNQPNFKKSKETLKLNQINRNWKGKSPSHQAHSLEVESVDDFLDTYLGHFMKVENINQNFIN